MEIISKEMIRPSTPTPAQHQIHKLSLLDQLAPSHFFPLIFFYQSNSDSGCCKVNHLHASLMLKESLSLNLNRFYPLSGRIKGSCYVDCNDSGALYVEAKVHSILSQEIMKGRVEDLDQYLPIHPHAEIDVLVAIQVNFFDCNGLAIGVCISHKIADGLSMVMFMNSWASICRGDSNNLHPEFDLASNHFNPINLPDFGTKCSSVSSKSNVKEKFVARRLVFDKEKLKKLKKEISLIPGIKLKNPSKVGIVTAFLWKSIMDVGNIRRGCKKSAAIQAFNLRSRVNPPLPEHAFGNIWTYQVSLTNSECYKQYHNLIGELRNGITQMNQKDNSDNSDKLLSDLFEMEETEICTFSSWCRFPVYQVDFGWGKPMFVSTTAIPFKNTVILMSTRDSEGIEACVNMLKDDLHFLQKDKEFNSLIVTESA